MNTLDIIVLVVLVLSAGFAYARGFVREVLAIVAWAGAAVIALYGYVYIVPLMAFLPRGPLQNGAAAAVVFIVALIVLSIITGGIAARVSRSGLSSLDRVFGLLFGIARGVILVCLGYIALTWYLPPDRPQPNWVKQARSRWLLEDGANAIEGLVPEVWRRPHKPTVEATPGESKGKAGATATDADSAAKALMAPKPVAKPVPDAPAYNKRDREDMNRLIEQQQAPK